MLTGQISAVLARLLILPFFVSEAHFTVVVWEGEAPVELLRWANFAAAVRREPHPPWLLPF
jgi:hypothetical protein